MKIQSNKVDDFIKSFDNKTKGFLIYGPDVGLVSIRKQEILKKILPDYKTSLSLISITNSLLKEKPSIIADEYNSFSLFGNEKKVILIEDAENSLSKELEKIFTQTNNCDNFIIITADDLDTKSSLKKFAENSTYFASLPCYKDDINIITQIIHQKLKQNGFKYNMDVVKTLADSFGGDRLIILNELEKLFIYKGENKELTIQDIKMCIQDNSEANINDFINCFASLNFELAHKKLQTLYFENIFPVVIVRSLINYFLKLQLYKFQLQNGITFEELCNKENIFWKQKPILVEHLKKLSLKMINNILYILAIEECKIKGKVL